MNRSRWPITKILGYVLIFSALYISLVPIIYFLSSFLLTKGVVLRAGLLRDFQRDFYINRGFR
jgi:hypothetical protein